MKRWLLAALGFALVLAPSGWVVTDALERDNGFCVSCHLSEGVPLHRDKHRDLGATPPLTLSAAHAATLVEGRDDAAFRCIDCHGGSGWLGRSRVKLLSARDAFWYVVGRFDEPQEMRWPLWDADCRKCHGSFDEVAEGQGEEAWGEPGFHELSVHNAALGVACVDCHRVHAPGGLVDQDFLHPETVRSQCALCHPEFDSAL